MSQFTRHSVKVPANGVELDAWLYLPVHEEASLNKPAPAIVMSHGFAAVKELYIDKFAEAFAKAGFAVLLYDHRNFGKSGGEPRGEIIPYQQIEDMREVISWLSFHPEVNAEQIGVWGTSYSGGHAIMVGALDRRAKCVVAQVPTISGYQTFLRRAGSRLRAVQEEFEQDRTRRSKGETPTYIGVIPQEEQPGIYASDEAMAFYSKAWTLAEGWDNRVTLRSSEKASEYEPGLWIARVSPTPLLMIVAENDTVTPTDLALSAFTRALEPKRLSLLPGGHFDPYVKHSARSITEAITWFSKYLK
ncbi:alpha/beta hydrolase [Shewanella alkalitolerans]|uniref:alpha/beta hydrolase n=1 Tax=Shewanella alkalitolerans TaxID=2864209 RepID=UPI001C65F52F|nr:alpha/beta hydrolase [Shewanella alkalitolerans]QYJ96626.1 alpha/beta hydrolase [Shewanella alkalitolerans]